MKSSLWHLSQHPQNCWLCLNHGRLRVVMESGVLMAYFQQPSITMLQSQKKGVR